MISSHCPDLVILDLGLPDMDGLDILRSLRSWSSLPVVVVSARSHERDKVAALDLGADDYLTKPFASQELLARIRAMTREQTAQTTSQLHVGNITLDRATFELSTPSEPSAGQQGVSDAGTAHVQPPEPDLHRTVPGKDLGI